MTARRRRLPVPALAALVLALLAPPLSAAPALPDSSLVNAVDPFIGTGGHGHTFPGPAWPFGMVQLSPDTRLTGWDGCSGYHFDDTVVAGFSHTHLSGTGVSDGGDVLLMPVAGGATFASGWPDDPDHGYASRFRKATERAGAGWYAVRLDDGGIDVTLTVTPRTGLHRYVFPAGRPMQVVVDLRHRDALLDADLRQVDARTVAGMRRSRAWAQDQRVYFRAAFSRPLTGVRLLRGATAAGERPVAAILSFGRAGKGEAGVLTVQVALSAVDDAGAAANLRAEWAGFDVAAARARARAAWARELDRVAVAGASPGDRTVLATALYHCFLAPCLFSDADGRYRGRDGAVHRAAGDRYTVFSLWDTYRAAHPLFTLLQRRRTADFCATMLDQYDQAGRLPVWELWGNETNCMIGYHAVSVLADAVRKGIAGVDPRRALAACVATADAAGFDLPAYRRRGYLAADTASESVSKTLEYAYDDACIALLAATAGDTAATARFTRRAGGWRHLFDPATRFFRPRRNGQWLRPFDPRRVDNNYTEANAWQYRFAVPQQAAALAALMGGDAAFTAALDSLFTTASELTGREQPDVTGLIGQYAHGNEPSHHVAWLYHTAGRPDRTAARVAAILDRFYRPAPDGLAGNEDCGQMSAWYVLAACGLYDPAPGGGRWWLVPPRFPRVTLRFEDGRTLTIRRKGAGDVHRVLWNGRPLRRSWLWHREVIGGGELVFELGARGDWGTRPEDRPPDMIFAPLPVPAPWADAPADRFRGAMAVRLVPARPGDTVHGTVVTPPPAGIAAAVPAAGPPADPARWPAVTAPLRLDRAAAVRFAATDGRCWSPVVTARFAALPPWLVALDAVPNPQYTAGGPDALIDGVRGPDDWRRGDWIGVQGSDVTVTVTFDRPLPLTRAGCGFLQDMRSWIWLPPQVAVAVSPDGRTFHDAGRARCDVPRDAPGIIRRDLTVPLDGAPVRAVRIHAAYPGAIPAWHPGAGGEAFLFLDEVVVAPR